MPCEAMRPSAIICNGLQWSAMVCERSRKVERDHARLEMIAESWRAIGNDRKKCGGTGETGSPLTVLTILDKILSITCDNASPNDKMMTELPKRLPEFPGETNHTLCFNHTIALVAVRVVRQFDVPSGDTETIMNEAEQELRELADGIDIEEEVTQQEQEVDDDDESDDDI